MKITALETLRLGEHPNLVWVRVHTVEGLTGLGESWFGAAAVEADLHSRIAPLVLGEDAAAIERLNRRMRPYVGFAGTGAEIRALSALDVALWDIAGKAKGRPICDLFGRVRDDIASRLHMRTPRILVHGFDRPNIHLGCSTHPDAKKKLEAIVAAVKETPKPGIVYVGTRADTARVATALGGHQLSDLVGSGRPDPLGGLTGTPALALHQVVHGRQSADRVVVVEPVARGRAGR